MTRAASVLTVALVGSVFGDGTGQNVAIVAGAITGSLIGSSPHPANRITQNLET